ncbi:MAG TPA: hypothetical protein VGB42_05580 [Candidatus Thermoplasmatota archaeon]
MATSIKVRDGDKRRLDRLQGEIMARRGRKVSQQELIAMLLDLGESLKERFFDDDARPMTAREIAALDRLIVSTGVRTREEDIDDDVTSEAR